MRRDTDVRILLTGASSFTGFWFASELARMGHDVTATFRGRPDTYGDVRGARVQQLMEQVNPVWGTSFGSELFLDLVGAAQFDLFCHHAAETANYRGWDFDTLAASASNTRNARSVLQRLAERGCKRVIVTGTVFEPYEGRDDCSQRAFSPYGLSKHISFELFRLEAYPIGMKLGKFVIPNPFGPYEEPRFTSYMMREWSEGRVPAVQTPYYLRDNIHVSLLARAYAHFCETSDDGTALVTKCSPSGYVETQAAFAQRFAREIGTRLGRNLEVKLSTQRDFSEPMVRANLEPAVGLVPEWFEDDAWEELCAYYRARFLQ